MSSGRCLLGGEHPLPRLASGPRSQPSRSLTLKKSPPSGTRLPRSRPPRPALRRPRRGQQHVPLRLRRRRQHGLLRLRRSHQHVLKWPPDAGPRAGRLPARVLNDEVKAGRPERPPCRSVYMPVNAATAARAAATLGAAGTGRLVERGLAISQTHRGHGKPASQAAACGPAWSVMSQFDSRQAPIRWSDRIQNATAC